MLDNLAENPESNSFEYIHMLLEALNKMGRLDVAVSRMEQRLPVELFAIVERTNHEVDVRHPAHLRSSFKDGWTGLQQALSEDSTRGEVLPDLLWTLYSKFEAVAEGHRVAHDVIAGIVEREGLRQTYALLGGFQELWKLFQSEMRSLLHDYLASDGSPLRRASNNSTITTNIFQRSQRDKSKRVFKLASMDQQSAEMAVEQDELDKILQASVPGLVSKSHRLSGKTHGDRSVAYDGPAIGHKLLLEPSVFNISSLLPPSISFLQRLKDIVPSDSDIAISTLTSFLDDFLVNVFTPQLDDTLTELCNQVLLELDTFRQDPQWADHARRPILKGGFMFFSLIKAFCRILDAIPEDQNFTQLVITQLATFHDKCSAWYKALVTRAIPDGGTRFKSAAAMIESDDLGAVVKDLWKLNESDRAELKPKEVELLVSKTNETPLEPFDIISDRRSVEALCLLYSSMRWLASRLSSLRRVTGTQAGLSSDLIKGGQVNRWTAVSMGSVRDDEQPVYLPMSKDLAAIFDGIVSAYQDLAMKALLTLHVDMRCGIIHMLSRTFQAQYLLDQPANEPDPNILALNADLLSFDDTLMVHLPVPEYQFITNGLGILIDTLLVAYASRISLMNENGCGQMQLNVLVLQQNLKSIENDITLSRSSRYYEYFGEGADAIVSKAKETGGKDMGFNLEELEVLVKLCHSEPLQSSQRDLATQAKRALSDHLLQLSESMWNT